MRWITSHERPWRQRRALGVVAGLLCLGLLATAVSGQPTAQESGPPQAEKTAVKKKPRGRLPAYFAKVVTQQQREDIYEIQARFNAQIEQLQKQIDELVAKRDQEVEAVLTAEQLAEVKKLRNDAKKRRTARRKTDEKKQD